jgi:hypothetical protein
MKNKSYEVICDPGHSWVKVPYMDVKEKSTNYSVTLGSALAIAISWSINKSILWAILHGLLGWIYVIYYAVNRD